MGMRSTCVLKLYGVHLWSHFVPFCPPKEWKPSKNWDLFGGNPYYFNFKRVLAKTLDIKKYNNVIHSFSAALSR